MADRPQVAVFVPVDGRPGTYDLMVDRRPVEYDLESHEFSSALKRARIDKTRSVEVWVEDETGYRERMSR